MTLYFNIGDILSLMEKEPDPVRRPDLLVGVHDSLSGCGGFPDDVFVLRAAPRLLDLTGEQAAQKLAALLDHAPLYRINAELALDSALAARHENAALEKALSFAFAGNVLPRTQKGGEEAGTLRHPMLGHIDSFHLARAYTGFLNALGPDRADFGFEGDILGRHPELFLGLFDGFIHEHRGRVRALTLLRNSTRRSHDSMTSTDGHVQNGRARAAEMNVRDPQEALWAWLEAESCQMRRCADIHRFMTLYGRKEGMDWLRADVFSLLEREAMKQHFAAILARHGPVANSPLGATIVANASGDVDENLQKLLGQILGNSGAYDGCAGRFRDEAEKRAERARRGGLV